MLIFFTLLSYLYFLLTVIYIYNGFAVTQSLLSYPTEVIFIYNTVAAHFLEHWQKVKGKVFFSRKSYGIGPEA